MSEAIAVSKDVLPKTERLRAFLLIALQFGLLVFIVERFSLESEAFRWVLVLAFGGFLVHHFLAPAYRQVFFLALSIGAILMVYGMSAEGWDMVSAVQHTAALLAIGTGLVLICHLPFSLTVRVVILLAVGCLLAALRAGEIANLEGLSAVWPRSTS